MRVDRGALCMLGAVSKHPTPLSVSARLADRLPGLIGFHYGFSVEAARHYLGQNKLAPRAWDVAHVWPQALLSHF